MPSSASALLTHAAELYALREKLLDRLPPEVRRVHTRRGRKHRSTLEADSEHLSDVIRGERSSNAAQARLPVLARGLAYLGAFFITTAFVMLLAQYTASASSAMSPTASLAAMVVMEKSDSLKRLSDPPSLTYSDTPSLFMF